MYYHFLVHKDKDGYWAECVELTGCNTQADTFEELQLMMFDALNLYLSDKQTAFPAPKTIIKIPVNPEIAKSLRLEHQ